MTDTGSATFLGYDGVLVSNPGTILSAGSCVASEQSTSDPRYEVAIQMNAGNVTVSNPVGTSIALTSIPALPGLYQTTLPSGFIPTSGGVFSFSESGSLGVGSFNASIAFPTPTLTWTNQAQTATVSRSNDLPISWVGAAPGSLVVATGSSSAGNCPGSSHALLRPRQCSGCTLLCAPVPLRRCRIDKRRESDRLQSVRCHWIGLQLCYWRGCGPFDVGLYLTCFGKTVTQAADKRRAVCR
jgi:hypothetical protein